MYVHIYTLYVHGMYILRCKRVCTLFRRVCTCLYYYVRVLNHINMYVQCTNLYIECCVAHVQCTDGYIHFMKCTEYYRHCWTRYTQWYILLDAAFFICLVCWPVGWDWLLPGVITIPPPCLAVPALALRAGGRRRPGCHAPIRRGGGGVTESASASVSS